MELYANGVKGGAFARQEMKLSAKPSDVPGTHVYSASVSSDRRLGDYAARLVPNFVGASIPLEDARILWQR